MDKDKPQIGILGGSFDPVHMGHIGLAQEAYEKFGLDQILFVPVFQSPHKSHTPLASTVHRREMLRLALKENCNFGISDIEICQEELSYTINTLNYYELKFSNSQLFLVIGQDNLLALDSWKNAKKIMERFHILVALRPGVESFSPENKVLNLFNGESPYKLSKVKNGKWEFFHRRTGMKLIVFNISPRDISSSAVRQKLADGTLTKKLLPPEVEAYIIRHRIYQTESQHNTG